MFNKSEPDNDRSKPSDTPSDESVAKAPTQGHTGRTATTIGPTIQITGDVLVTGNQNVHIEGHVNGTITLNDNILSIGKEGEISATVKARAIFVGGKVDGDLFCDEQIVIQSSGNVRGNIVAPRVTLEDGCKFKGSIDMDAKPKAAQAPKEPGASKKVSDIKRAPSGGAATETGIGTTSGG